MLHSDSAINQGDSLLTILCYQIPTQASVQPYTVSSHGNMSSYTASEDKKFGLQTLRWTDFIFSLQIFLSFQTAEYIFF